MTPRTSMTGSFRPLETAAYLHSRGWQVLSDRPDRYSIWGRRDWRGEEVEVLLPAATDAPDMPRRLAELFDTLAAVEGRTVAEVREDLATPHCDVIRARLAAEGMDSSLPLDTGAEAFRHTRDLLLAAACSAWRPKAVYGPRKPDEAVNVLRRARLGQTRPGSYVITVLVPLPPSTGVRPDIGDEPPARRTTTLLAGGLRGAVAAARSSAMTGRWDASVREGVSANFCDALAGLTGIGRGVRFDFSWSPSRAVGPEPIRVVDVPADASDYLAAIAESLRTSADIEDVAFVGSVTRLARDSDDVDIVTLSGMVDGVPRTVRCRVGGDLRKRLTTAYEARSSVACAGDLVREGKFHVLKNVRSLEVEAAVEE